MKILKRLLFLPLLVALLLGGCMREYRSDCGRKGLRLQFAFTYHNEGKDLLREDIGDIRVYVFDAGTGLLAAIVAVSEQDIARGYVDVDLPAGQYTLVAWGGSGDDLMSGGFMDAAMHDPASHTHTSPAVVGQTTLEEFRMMLRYSLSADGLPGDAIPDMDWFDDLFFAIARNVAVSSSVRDVTVDFDFLHTTSVLKVNIEGLNRLPTRSDLPLDVFVTGKGGIYGYDGSLDGYAPVLRYLPSYPALDAGFMSVEFKLLRPEIARHLPEPVLLHVRDAATGRDLITPLDVLRTIMLMRDGQDNLLYRTQSDIDREHEFTINIEILSGEGHLVVRISVMGWETVQIYPIVA